MKLRRRKTRPHRAQRFEQPIWCGICHIRVAPYETAIKVMHNIYHPHCLDHLRHQHSTRPPMREPDFVD